jgi:2,3-bisphosphoglycerate-dependent phosphoglycerate mutase
MGDVHTSGTESHARPGRAEIDQEGVVVSSTVILLRHGQSTWNQANRFTGWWDADLTDAGEAEALTAGRRLADVGILPDVVHTSLQTRAIRTADLALRELDRSWIPVRRHWRLNERHYGDLTGLNKEETRLQFGDDQFLAWRRGYDTPPPAMRDEHPFDPSSDARYAALAPELIPVSECLSDVVDRLLPYWYDDIVPDLRAGVVVLVSAHGNSLRALCKHLDNISNDEIAQLEIPTGVPLVYDLDHDMRPTVSKPTLQRLI